MEKNTPHHDLAMVKERVRRLGRHAFTKTALNAGWDLSFTVSDMQATVYELGSGMFYKSMTTYSDHRIWQDVYHTHSRAWISTSK